MIITTEWLKRHWACETYIGLFEINFPEGLDLDKVKIDGDFNNIFKWIYTTKNNKKHQPLFGVKTNRCRPINSSKNFWVHSYDESASANNIREMPVSKSYQYIKDDTGRLVEIIEDGATACRIKYLD